MVPSASSEAEASNSQVACVQLWVNDAVGASFGSSVPPPATTTAPRARQSWPSMPGPLTVVAVPATGRPAALSQSWATRSPEVMAVYSLPSTRNMERTSFHATPPALAALEVRAEPTIWLSGENPRKCSELELVRVKYIRPVLRS